MIAVTKVLNVIKWFVWVPLLLDNNKLQKIRVMQTWVSRTGSSKGYGTQVIVKTCGPLVK